MVKLLKKATANAAKGAAKIIRKPSTLTRSSVKVWTDFSGLDAPLYALKRLGVEHQVLMVFKNSKTDRAQTLIIATLFTTLIQPRHPVSCQFATL